MTEKTDNSTLFEGNDLAMAASGANADAGKSELADEGAGEAFVKADLSPLPDKVGVEGLPSPDTCTWATFSLTLTPTSSPASSA